MKKILGLAILLVIISGCSSDYWLRSTGNAALADKLKRENQKEEEQRLALEAEKQHKEAEEKQRAWEASPAGQAVRQSEEEWKAGEPARQAEMQRREAEEWKAGEPARKAAEAEEARKAEEVRKTEEARKAEEIRKAEETRKAEEAAGPNEKMRKDLLKVKANIEQIIKNNCADAGKGVQAVGFAEGFNSVHVGSSMNMLSCSGMWLHEGRTDKFISGGRLAARIEPGDGEETTYTFPTNDTVKIGITSTSQSNIIAQVAIGPGTAEIVDVTLPGMDAGGSLVMIVGGRGVTVTTKALISHLTTTYRKKYAQYALSAFAGELVANSGFRKEVLADFTPESPPRKVKTAKQ